MPNNPVGWFEIYVQDMERAKKFYEPVFQLKLQRLNNPGLEVWSFPMAMDRVGASGALIEMDGFPLGRNSTLVYFTCTDCAVEAGRVTPSGGRMQ